jgi:ribosomal protein L29
MGKTYKEIEATFASSNPPYIEVVEEIRETEKILFDLRFKKATRLPFKSHEIKTAKKKVAQLKTFLCQAVK